ncbi:hypothetical protein [Planomicrobium okeanokoites]|uniref:Uncharacterized protein n=1 Tax=Planomicrobium okeanokoites TaxID=244 RepID=A0ABV7KK24_PLAOK|nr:hypothetical protein [Planomicrobium okeanokoites]
MIDKFSACANFSESGEAATGKAQPDEKGCAFLFVQFHQKSGPLGAIRFFLIVF